MGKEDFAYHETVDTHEIMNVKTIGLLKSKLIQGVVFDQDLRELLQKNVDMSIIDIRELQRLYSYAQKG